MKKYESTNNLLKEVLKDLELLIGWAEADHQHSIESECSKNQIATDKSRYRALIKARILLENCYKD